MAQKDIKGNWIDGQGRTAHPSLIDGVDKKRDQTVESIFRAVVPLQTKIAQVKETVISKFDKFLEYASEQNGVNLGGEKGNVTLTSFSGNLKVERAVQEYIDYDERILAVKQLIDECLEEWTEDVKTPIKPIVSRVFRVDQKGKFNSNALRQLRRMNIKHKKWTKAMDLLAAAEQVVSTKTYYRFYVRDDNGEFQPISLNFKDVEPATKPEGK